MEKYRYVLTLNVEVEAFNEDDAWEAIQDTFGVGVSESGVTVTECEWDYKK